MEKPKIKYLILGATGMAGHTIALYLKEQGHEVITFTRNVFPLCNNIVGDAMDKKLIETILNTNEFDVVVNCIGVLNSSCDEDPAKAVYLNSYLPHYIASVIKNKKTQLIHMSTDCVFSGNNGNYNENSFRDGESFYDRTKALGEVDDSANLTFRNSIIGPDMNRDGIGLFNWFMKAQGKISGYSHALWTGVTTLTLAKAIEAASYEKLTGIYNLVNNHSISKLDLLKLMNKHFREDNVTINSSSQVKIDKSLVNNRTDFSFHVPDYEDMIIEMSEWVESHKELYSHYFETREVRV